MFFRMALAATVISLSSMTAFAAGSFGIPVCDAFLAKYQACITRKAPANLKPNYQADLDKLRSGLLQVKKTARREQMENVCKMLPARIKREKTLGNLDCALD